MGQGSKRPLSAVGRFAIDVVNLQSRISQLETTIGNLVARELKARREMLAWKRQAESWRQIAQRGGRV